jgi:hypothetical protein
VSNSSYAALRPLVTTQHSRTDMRPTKILAPLLLLGMLTSAAAAQELAM